MNPIILPLSCTRTLLGAAALLLTGASQAGEIYGQVGMPGAGLGYAHPVSPKFTVRADFVTLGKHRKTTNESGILYDATLKANRAGLYGDWFPFGGVFRFTGGVTSNNYQLTLDASGAGGTLNVGGRTYTTTAADGLNVQIQFPKTTPYLGLGWGHQQASGLRFAFDVGASLGRAKLTAVGRGQLANPANQADIDAELAELRDGVGKVRALPQISFSLGYSF